MSNLLGQRRSRLTCCIWIGIIGIRTRWNTGCILTHCWVRDPIVLIRGILDLRISTMPSLPPAHKKEDNAACDDGKNHASGNTDAGLECRCLCDWGRSVENLLTC